MTALPYTDTTDLSPWPSLPVRAATAFVQDKSPAQIRHAITTPRIGVPKYPFFRSNRGVRPVISATSATVRAASPMGQDFSPRGASRYAFPPHSDEDHRGKGRSYRPGKPQTSSSRDGVVVETYACASW